MAEPTHRWGFVRQRRVELGMSVAQLAVEVGVTSQYIAMIERGERRLYRNVDVLGRLAEALKVDVTELDRSRPPWTKQTRRCRPSAQIPAEVA